MQDLVADARRTSATLRSLRVIMNGRTVRSSGVPDESRSGEIAHRNLARSSVACVTSLVGALDTSSTRPVAVDHGSRTEQTDRQHQVRDGLVPTPGSSAIITPLPGGLEAFHPAYSRSVVGPGAMDAPVWPGEFPAGPCSDCLGSGGGG